MDSDSGVDERDILISRSVDARPANDPYGHTHELRLRFRTRHPADTAPEQRPAAAMSQDGPPAVRSTDSTRRDEGRADSLKAEVPATARTRLLGLAAGLRRFVWPWRS
jgi:hypothetical protein